MKKIFLFSIKWSMIFIFISLVVFYLIRLMPISPIEMHLTNLQLPPTEENIKILSESWGLDKPLIYQYGVWLLDFIQGNWGKSYITNSDLLPEIIRRLPYSLTIGLGGLFFASVLGFFLGYLAALKKNGFWDLVSRFLAIFSQTVPIFVVIVIVVYFIGVKYQLVRIFTGDGNFALFLGVFFIALSSIGFLSRVVCAHFRELMDETYIKSYISRGFNPKTVLLKNGWQPVLYGLFSVLIYKFAWVIGGSSIVEFALGIPGISYFVIRSIEVRDYLIIQAYIMVIVIWMFLVHVLFNIILDLLVVKKNEK